MFAAAYEEERVPQVAARNSLGTISALRTTLGGRHYFQRQLNIHQRKEKRPSQNACFVRYATTAANTLFE